MFSLEQYDALHGSAGLLDRRGRGRLFLTGPDRRAYLHGLLTNDIAALSPGSGCYAALLTPQGRMISDMRVSELGDRLLIDLPEFTAGAVHQRLADFIFTEDVNVQDAAGTHTHFGLYGPRAAALLAAGLLPEGQQAGRDRFDRMSVNDNVSYPFAGGTVIVVRSDDFGQPGFELFVENSGSADIAGALRALGARDVTAAAANVVRVESGRPEFGVDMDEHTIPLEAGIEDRAISLSKGCYVGQEVIIRVLHRGQGRVAKRLVGLAGETGAEMERGDRLYASGKDVGVVTSAVVSPRLGRPIALGYAHRDYAEPGHELDVGSADGTRSVTVVRVPFTSPAAG